MTQYKLTYFDFDGGRGEPVRIALRTAGIDFEDHRITFEQFMKDRSAMRFTCVPVLEIGGEQFTQSNSMLRYVGKKAGLYPNDDLQALYCDETMGAVEDLLNHVVRTFGLEGDELRQAREKLVDGWITTFAKGLAKLLERGGGTYFADGRLTVADLKVQMQVKSLRSGTLDHVPADLIDRIAPSLAAHCDRVSNESVVKNYYQDRTG